MDRCIRKLIWLLACVLLLSGCARLELNYIIEDDGTVQASYLIAADKTAEEYADINDLMNAARKKADSNGFSVSDYNRNGYSGILASKTIKQDDLMNTGSEMLGFSVLPDIIKDFSWNYEPSMFRNHYRLRMTIDLKEVIDKEALDNLPSDMKDKAQNAIERSEVKVNLTLPGKPDQTNADETNNIAGKNATLYSWSMKPGDYKTLLIDATLEKDKARNPVIWLSAALVITVILVIVLYICKRKKRAKR